MSEYRTVKRLLLSLVVGGLVLAALAGIYVLLFGRFGRTEERILLTTLSVSYFSVTALACAALFEKKRNRLLAVPGLAASVAGFALFVALTWGDRSWWRCEALCDTTTILAVFAFSFAQACLLSFVPLRRATAWVYYAAVTSILTLAVLISAMILAEPFDEEPLLRAIGAVAILDGCLTLCLPVLHWLGGKAERPAAAEAGQRIELVCPRCAERATYTIGAIRCRRCLLGIRVEIEEARIHRGGTENTEGPLKSDSQAKERTEA